MRLVCLQSCRWLWHTKESGDQKEMRSAASTASSARTHPLQYESEGANPVHGDFLFRKANVRKSPEHRCCGQLIHSTIQKDSGSFGLRTRYPTGSGGASKRSRRCSDVQ